jgi:hypothetical protein
MSPKQLLKKDAGFWSYLLSLMIDSLISLMTILDSLSCVASNEKLALICWWGTGNMRKEAVVTYYKISQNFYGGTDEAPKIYYNNRPPEQV